MISLDLTYCTEENTSPGLPGENIFQNSDTIDSRGWIRGMYGVVTTRTPTIQTVEYDHLLWIPWHLGTMPVTMIITTRSSGTRAMMTHTLRENLK
jgi:hypothetical protein